MAGYPGVHDELVFVDEAQLGEGEGESRLVDRLGNPPSPCLRVRRSRVCMRRPPRRAVTTRLDIADRRLCPLSRGDVTSAAALGPLSRRSTRGLGPRRTAALSCAAPTLALPGRAGRASTPTHGRSITQPRSLQRATVRTSLAEHAVRVLGWQSLRAHRAVPDVASCRPHPEVFVAAQNPAKRFERGVRKNGFDLGLRRRASFELEIRGASNRSYAARPEAVRRPVPCALGVRLRTSSTLKLSASASFTTVAGCVPERRPALARGAHRHHHAGRPRVDPRGYVAQARGCDACVALIGVKASTAPGAALFSSVRWVRGRTRRASA